ncbi:YdcF family protein [Alkalilimnicola ehrlichii]|uniref:YdcF family protein n=1 Tax=Alkalilimnicola ehrlichii TaxID=351052 RepID=UPI003B9EC33C
MALRSLADWLLPPSGPLLLALLGLLLSRWRPGRLLLLLGLLLAWLSALPPVGYALMDGLQADYPPVQPAQLRDAQAIVVLGAGYRSGADEFSGETVNDLALVRLRYAAYLHRETGLPVIASGGAATDREPEARWMAEVLAEFGVDPILTESEARDTWGNAQHTAELLARQGLSRVALVSHAHHMPRAVWAFEQAGVTVLPAPTGAFVPHDRGWSWGMLRPQANALRMSWLAMHEYLGLFWYRWMRGD